MASLVRQGWNGGVGPGRANSQGPPAMSRATLQPDRTWGQGEGSRPRVWPATSATAQRAERMKTGVVPTEEHGLLGAEDRDGARIGQTSMGPAPQVQASFRPGPSSRNPGHDPARIMIRTATT